MLAALLSGATPTSLEEGQLVISYPPSAAFSKRKVESAANKERIADALRLLTGDPLVLRFELSEQHASDSAGIAYTEAVLDEEEAIAAFKAAFDAEDVVDAADHAQEEGS
jgi:hypothetical protein